jgi:hypothetical protein
MQMVAGEARATAASSQLLVTSCQILMALIISATQTPADSMLCMENECLSAQRADGGAPGASEPQRRLPDALQDRLR